MLDIGVSPCKEEEVQGGIWQEASTRVGWMKPPQPSATSWGYFLYQLQQEVKPGVSIAFSKEEIHVPSKKLRCYLPKHQGEFSDAVFCDFLLSETQPA